MMNDTTQSITAMVDAAIYDVYLEVQPSFVEAIRDAMAFGQSPAQIERQMRRRFGSTQIVRNVRHIAEHIQRNGLAQERNHAAT